MSRRYYLTV